jgi:hypothetical protein
LIPGNKAVRFDVRAEWNPKAVGGDVVGQHIARDIDSCVGMIVELNEMQTESSV